MRPCQATDQRFGGTWRPRGIGGWGLANTMLLTGWGGGADSGAAAARPHAEFPRSCRPTCRPPPAARSGRLPLCLAKPARLDGGAGVIPPPLEPTPPLKTTPTTPPIPAAAAQLLCLVSASSERLPLPPPLTPRQTCAARHQRGWPRGRGGGADCQRAGMGSAVCAGMGGRRRALRGSPAGTAESHAPKRHKRKASRLGGR